MTESLIHGGYLVASVLFILGLKGLARPRTAVRANLLGATGLLLAVVVTLLDREIVGFGFIVWGLAIGAAIGAALAVKIQLTAMPQLVALFNALGGGASVLVAGAAVMKIVEPASAEYQLTVAGAVSAAIGSVTFWGSLVAFGKLQGLLSEKSVVFAGQAALNLASGLVCVGLGVWYVMQPETVSIYWSLAAAASMLGVLVLLPVGGADMPVLIALLNSFSGLACSATGFALDNSVLIIAGSLVGAAGLILTQLMCRAMNRSLLNVLLGGGAASGEVAAEEEIYAGRIKTTSAEEVAMLFDSARRVAIVPGYGMAVAQAQHAVRTLTDLLEKKGIEVEFAIHPVAGRMPGHMNVLLAEAEIPYEKLKDLDEANPTFPQIDVAIVIGANDVVNPLARTDPNSPIAGMPILDVDKARTIVIIKRSLSPGFAGIPNPLFAADNTLMFFGDGKKAVLELIEAVRAA